MVAGVIIAPARGDGWSRLARRYDDIDGMPTSDRRDPVDLWRALDRGEDPTVGDSPERRRWQRLPVTPTRSTSLRRVSTPSPRARLIPGSRPQRARRRRPRRPRRRQPSPAGFPTPIPRRLPTGWPAVGLSHSAPRTSGKAIAVMVLGIVGLVMSCGYGIGIVSAIVALALAPGAKREIAASGGMLTRRGVRQGRSHLLVDHRRLAVLGIVALIACSRSVSHVVVRRSTSH